MTIFQIKSVIRKIFNLFVNQMSKIHLSKRARLPIIPTILKNDRLDQYIWVYQPGRVGSGTIVESLFRCGIKALHCHHLSEATLAQFDDIYAEDRVPTVMLNNFLRQKYFYQFFRYLLQHNPPSDESHYKIITLTREPISYFVSYYFYNYPNFFKYFIKRKYGHSTAPYIKEHFTDCINYYMSVYNENPKELIKSAGEHIRSADLRYFILLVRTIFFWFDREIQTFFRCNVFNEPFDVESGYHIYQGHNVSVLLIRYENLYAIGDSIISNFLDQPGFKLVPANVSKEQSHYKEYRDFVSSYIMPEEFVKHLHESSMAKHFYSNDELNAIASKWFSQNKELNHLGIKPGL